MRYLHSHDTSLPYHGDLPDGHYTYPPSIHEQNDPEYLLKADEVWRISMTHGLDDFEIYTEADPTDEPSPIHVVALYHVDRAFGGREEGGWWYDYGYPIPIAESVRLGVEPGIFTTLEEAMHYRDRLEPLIDLLNDGRPPISSVISEGRYALYITDDYPKPFPDSTPRYE